MKTTTRRILPYELALNEALPWTLYDEFGNLLLRQGFVIRQQRHLDSLFMRGAYIRVQEPDAPEEEVLAAAAQEAPRQRKPHRAEPVYMRVRRLANSLERLHASLRAGELRRDMRMLVIGMAHVIAQACKDDADALLAALHTNRSHSYLAVQQLLGAAVVELLAAEAGIDEHTRTVWICAALTRDVGMMDLQQQLDVQTAPLTPAQQLDIRGHTDYAETMLRHMGVKDPLWIQVVREHHERCDGSGYPQQLLGPAICAGARLLAVADSYAAMVTPRANRSAHAPRQAMQTLYIERETAYDSTWVLALVRCLTLHPPGSTVILRNGDLALVRQRQRHLKEMEVWAIRNGSGALLQPPQRRCTASPEYALEQAVPLPSALAGIPDMAALWMPQTPPVLPLQPAPQPCET